MAPNQTARLLDIFQGRYGTNRVTWIETIAGTEAAIARMTDIASKRPGAYFVFDLRSGSVLGETDTTTETKTLLCL